MRLGIYSHYKKPQQLYEVLSLAFDAITEQPMVVYRALYDAPDLQDEYGIRPTFVRPLDSFNATLEIDGQTIRRFEFVSDTLPSDI